LVRTYTPIAHSAGNSIVRNEQDAKDIAHDSMLKVLKNLHRYSSQWRFSTWVMRIARNTAIDLVRRRRRLAWSAVPDTPDTRPLQDEIAWKRQQSTAVHRALSRLSPLYREVIELHHFRHLKYREIAEELEVPIGTVMNRIFRARRKMKEEYLSLAA
jgi:RNA polymerase sigma-70 factor (ECF subfamily)